MKSSATFDANQLEKFANIVINKWTEVVLRHGELISGIRDWEKWKERHLVNYKGDVQKVEYGELVDLFPTEMIERALVLGHLPD